MTDRYVVFGNPVGHSLSPRIHELFARQTGADIEYQAQLVPLDGFVRNAVTFFAEGGCGVNVTLPFKEAAYDWVSQCDEYAGTAGAVNTIVPVEGGFRGCNTDGLGLVRDLRENHGFSLRGSNVLILGAGGAVRGVLGPLLGASPGRIVIANRTAARAQALVDRLEDPRLSAMEPGKLSAAFDLVINGTSAGLVGALPQIPPEIVAGGVAYDMVYGANAKPFCDWATQHGARLAVDGLGMLVEQAAEAFSLWRGVRPDACAVLKALRESPR